MVSHLCQNFQSLVIKLNRLQHIIIVNGNTDNGVICERHFKTPSKSANYESPVF